jgi:hypothetical protein
MEPRPGKILRLLQWSRFPQPLLLTGVIGTQNNLLPKEEKMSSILKKR